MQQRLIIRTTDRRLFVSELLAYGAKGARMYENSVPSYLVPFTAELVVEVERGKEFQSTATCHAVPLPAVVYTEQQMKDMVWDEFRDACRELGVKGRDRAVMLEEYLKKAKHYTTNN